VRGLPADNPFPAPAAKKGKRGDNFVGNIFYAAEGLLVCPSYTGGIAVRPDGEIIREFKGGEDHFGNFVQAVRSRRAEDLHADILEGHLSSALCHLGNISYRLGTPTPFDKVGAVFNGEKDAAAALASMEEHLKAADVALDQCELRVGRKLAVDPKTETFPTSESVANQMLTREYRKGFEVPAKV